MRNKRNLFEAIQNSMNQWEATLSRFTDAEIGDLQRQLGYKPRKNPSIEEREEQAKQQDHKRKAHYEKIDWRNVDGKDYVSAAKVQGFCGSCVAFGVTSAMESRARILEGIPENSADGAALPDLSPAQLFYCGMDEEGIKCLDGWEIDDALDFARDYGVVPMECAPYPETPIAENDCEVCADADQKLTIIDDYTRLDTVQEMKDWIATKGPVITAFSVYLDFFFYRKGVYIKHDELWNLPMGGHCVTVVGFDDEQEAWIAKNSWGTRWGDAGFFYIGYNECGFDATMWGIESFKKIFKYEKPYPPKGGSTMSEGPSGLSESQITIVKSVVGELLKDKEVFVDTVKNLEVRLKAHLDAAGASDEDIAAIVGYFSDVEDDIKDDNLGVW